MMKCESWQVPYTQVSIFVRDYVVFQLLEVVRVWRVIAVAVCTEYGPKKEKQIRKPKPPLSRVRFFLEKEMFRNKVNSRGFVAAKSKVGSTEMDAKWDLLWLFLLVLMDWVTSGDCKQDLNWQLGLNELFKEGMEWNGMTDSITVKKGKAIADAYNSPDEDFALQNLALQIVNRFLAKL
ncbi:hypothetical protein LXL04_020461 [Taraxacum kok-saghyz]